VMFTVILITVRFGNCTDFHTFNFFVKLIDDVILKLFLIEQNEFMEWNASCHYCLEIEIQICPFSFEVINNWFAT
jgi:hypothetical protein